LVDSSKKEGNIIKEISRKPPGTPEISEKNAYVSPVRADKRKNKERGRGADWKGKVGVGRVKGYRIVGVVKGCVKELSVEGHAKRGLETKKDEFVKENKEKKGNK